MEENMWIYVMIVWFFLNNEYRNMLYIFLVFSSLVRQYVSGAGESLPCTWVNLFVFNIRICLPIRIVVFIKVQLLVLDL